jgi:hypothetical protein
MEQGGKYMMLKTENKEILIGMSHQEAEWLEEELDGLDTEGLGLIGLERLKYVIWAGLYIDK